MENIQPTEAQYRVLRDAYDHFNGRLFGARLPSCLITLQRKGHTLGFYCHERFARRDGSEVTAEIALNPAHFHDRSDEEIFSTLVHEMCHLWQYCSGSPSRGYHNKEWANKMEQLGLMPSDTGQPGGRRTGQKVSHYIIHRGDFQRVCDDAVRSGMRIRYVEHEPDKRTAKGKRASKTKFSCPRCGASAWAKATANLVCGDCAVALRGATP